MKKPHSTTSLKVAYTFNLDATFDEAIFNARCHFADQVIIGFWGWGCGGLGSFFRAGNGNAARLQVFAHHIGFIKTAYKNSIIFIADGVSKIDDTVGLLQGVFKPDRVIELAVENQAVVKNNVYGGVKKVGKISQIITPLFTGKKVGDIVD